MSELIIREIEAKSIITKTDIPVCDYAVNPYVGCTHGCKYCYASFMKRFTNHPEPWGEFLDVKYWPELRKAEKYAGKEMFFGTVTDPYNPQEEQYRRTRTLLEQLQGSGIKLSIQTKSDLVLRDVDLIRTFPEARVGFSINTLDEDFRADMDRAVSIERRLAATSMRLASAPPALSPRFFRASPTFRRSSAGYGISASWSGWKTSTSGAAIRR